MALLLKVGRCEALGKMLLWGTTVMRGLSSRIQEGTCKMQDQNAMAEGR